MCKWQIGQFQNIKIHTWLSGWGEQHKRNKFWNLNALSFPLLPSALKPSMNWTITFEKDHLFSVSETHKYIQNTARNLIKYNIFETYLGYRGCLTAVNLQIYLETLSLQWAHNVPKLLGVNYVAKNWAQVMMLKALPLAHFSSTLWIK